MKLEEAQGDGKYVLSRKPDYIIAGPANGAAVETPWFLSDLELANDPESWRNHEGFSVLIDHVAHPKGGKLALTYYKRVER